MTHPRAHAPRRPFLTAVASVAVGSLAGPLAAVLAVGISACSGAGGGSASSTDAKVPTHLDGFYEAATDGDLQWLSFEEPNVFGLLRSGSACASSAPAEDCYAGGTYSIDAVTGTLELSDWRTQTTLSLPLSAVQATVAATPLTTQAIAAGGNAIVSGSGGLVNGSSSSVVSPSGLSITNEDGTTQSLVQTVDLKNVIYTCVLVCQVCLSNPLQPQSPSTADIPPVATPSCLVKPKKN